MFSGATAYDNVAVEEIEYTPSMMFVNASHINTLLDPIMVVARDAMGNNASCQFQIHVKGEMK